MDGRPPSPDSRNSKEFWLARVPRRHGQRVGYEKTITFTGTVCAPDSVHGVAHNRRKLGIALSNDREPPLGGNAKDLLIGGIGIERNVTQHGALWNTPREAAAIVAGEEQIRHDSFCDRMRHFAW